MIISCGLIFGIPTPNIGCLAKQNGVSDELVLSPCSGGLLRVSLSGVRPDSKAHPAQMRFF
jgi:hypothetical protein